jgi:hypothetical protein
LHVTDSRTVSIFVLSTAIADIMQYVVRRLSSSEALVWLPGLYCYIRSDGSGLTEVVDRSI